MKRVVTALAAMHLVITAAPAAAKQAKMSENEVIVRIAECGGGVMATRHGLRLLVEKEYRKIGIGLRRSESLKAAFLDELEINSTAGSQAFVSYTECIFARSAIDEEIVYAQDRSSVIETQLRDGGVDETKIAQIMLIRQQQIEAMKEYEFVEAAILKGELTKEFVVSLINEGSDFSGVSFFYEDDDENVGMLAALVSAEEKMLVDKKVQAICESTFGQAYCELAFINLAAEKIGTESQTLGQILFELDGSTDDCFFSDDSATCVILD